MSTNSTIDDNSKLICNIRQITKCICTLIIRIYVLLIVVSADLAHRLARLLQARYVVAATAAAILT